MKIKQLLELSGVLGEGFFADNVFNNKDFVRASNYAKEVEIARRAMMQRGSLSLWSLERLHKLNRFYDWIHKTYGNTECHSYKEAEEFLLQKMEAIGKDTPDFVSFWSYLRKITLSEGSKLLQE